jgi:hypothetical protein
MSFGDCKDIGGWQVNRRKFLKILSLPSAVSAVGLLAPFTKMALGKEGSMSPEEMRIKAMQLFKKPKLFQ